MTGEKNGTKRVNVDISDLTEDKYYTKDIYLWSLVSFNLRFWLWIKVIAIFCSRIVFGNLIWVKQSLVKCIALDAVTEKSKMNIRSEVLW